MSNNFLAEESIRMDDNVTTGGNKMRCRRNAYYI